MTNETLTAEQTETYEAIANDEPSARSQELAAALLASCQHTTTALMAIVAALRDDCADADADLLTQLADTIARYEATVV
jgi:predicted kinase